MTRPPVHPKGRPLGPGVEWEFDKVTFDRSFSRNLVRSLLVERAEHGGWELAQVAPLSPRHLNRLRISGYAPEQFAMRGVR